LKKLDVLARYDYTGGGGGGVAPFSKQPVWNGRVRSFVRSLPKGPEWKGRRRRVQVASPFII